MIKKILVFFLYLFFAQAEGSSSEPSQGALTHVDGKHQVVSIEKFKDYYIVKFKKYPHTKDSKTIILEINQLNSELLHQGDLIEISAEVVEKDKDSVEAEQVLLHLARASGKTRIWLPSRKGKGVHFEGTSYLKMHSTDSDYRVF